MAIKYIVLFKGSEYTLLDVDRNCLAMRKMLRKMCFYGAVSGQERRMLRKRGRPPESPGMGRRIHSLRNCQEER